MSKRLKITREYEIYSDSIDLTAPNAVGGDSRNTITNEEFDTAPIGTKWAVYGSGSLFDYDVVGTKTGFREITIKSHYKDDDRNEKNTKIVNFFPIQREGVYVS